MVSTRNGEQKDIPRLTREYSRFPGSSGGLVSVMGAIIGFAFMALGDQFGTWPFPLVGFGLFLAFFIGKTYLQNLYYRQLGRVEEKVNRNIARVRRIQRWVMIGGSEVVVLLVFWALLFRSPVAAQGLPAWRWGSG